MQNDWASSLDLHVELEAAGGRRDAVERAVRTAIRSGRLRPGDRLPSTRALAHDLGLARGTVADAYAQLAVEGYLNTSPGAPTRVAAGPVAGDGAPSPEPVGDAGPSSSGARFDLRVGLPDLGAFPRAAWLRALRRALAGAPDRALVNGDPRGRPELRAALAGYLGRTRGVLAEPERIVVCSGYTQGLAIICGALRSSGVRAIAMEDPCLHHQRAIAAAAGFEIRPLAVDDEGASDEVPGGAGAAVITPAHQFPLGPTLAPARRSGLVAWGRATGAVVMEDDYDGEFRYDRQPPGALQGLDPSMSCTRARRARRSRRGCAWLAAVPAPLVEPVIEAKTARAAPRRSTSSRWPSCSPRAATTGTEPDAPALPPPPRPAARPAHHPRARAAHPRVAAGLHVALDVPEEAALVAHAAERSLALNGLGPFWHEPREDRQGVVLGYAAPPEHAYGRTLATLAEALRKSGAAG